MDMLKFSGLICVFLAVSVSLSVAETRYECMVNGESGDGIGDIGEADEFEPGEMPEADEMGMRSTRGYGMGMQSGLLSCNNGGRGSILVKRIAHGIGYGRCSSFSYCREEYDMGNGVADQCDGKSTCYVGFVPPVFLKCGRRSNYMLVEYECVEAWSSFEVCEQVREVVREPHLFITSPGYLSFRGPSKTRGTQMCECVVESADKSDLYMDYLQTDLSRDRDYCPYEYVMVESKTDINQTKPDQEMEVCGRRHVGGKWFSGSLRITYASGGPMQRRGMVVKLTADSKAGSPKLQIECGVVDASNLRLKDKPPPDSRPPPRQPTYNMRDTFGRGGMLPYGGMGMGMDDGPIDDGTERFGLFPSPIPLAPLGIRPPARPNPTANSRPKPGRVPDISTWKINLPAGTKPPKTPAAPVKPKPTPRATGPSRGVAARKPVASKPPNRKAAPAKPGQGRGQNRQNRGRKRPQAGQARPVSPNKRTPGRVVDDTDVVKTKAVDNDASTGSSGSFVGLVLGGIGAALILGGVTILAVSNYRKRQRIKREEREMRQAYGSDSSSTYGRGWEDQDESVYATVAEVEMHRAGCVNPAVDERDFHCRDTNLRETMFMGDSISNSSSGSSSGQEIVPASSSKKSEAAKLKKATQVAVIEVHQPYEGLTSSPPPSSSSSSSLSSLALSGSGEESCTLSVCSDYAVVKREGSGAVTVCAHCNLTVPPRTKRDSKRQATNPYDNNIGVKRNKNTL